MDISLHIRPRETSATLDTIENTIEDLEADVESLWEKRRADARGVRKDLEDYQALYDTLRNTSMQAFDTSMYLTTHGNSRDEITGDGVSSIARQSPANLTPVCRGGRSWTR